MLSRTISSIAFLCVYYAHYYSGVVDESYSSSLLLVFLFFSKFKRCFSPNEAKLGDVTPRRVTANTACTKKSDIVNDVVYI